MTTVSDRQFQDIRTEGANPAMRVEVIENDGLDRAWLNLSGEWVKIASVKNLWDIDGVAAGDKSLLRMHFRVVAESGRQLRLFQDLIDGCWYREVP
jgi:hypothetical protein